MEQNTTEAIMSMLHDIKGLLTRQEQKTEEEYMDIHQASKYANVSPSTIRRYYKSGRLAVSNNFGKTLIKKSDIDSFIQGA